jgi:hypothetical protein
MYDVDAHYCDTFPSMEPYFFVDSATYSHNAEGSEVCLMNAGSFKSRRSGMQLVRLAQQQGRKNAIEVKETLLLRSSFNGGSVSLLSEQSIFHELQLFVTEPSPSRRQVMQALANMI